MARTRGSSERFHQDGGVVLGKGGVPISARPNAGPLSHDMDQPAPLDRQGNPVSPAAAYLRQPMNISGHTVLRGPGAEPVPVAPTVTGYRANSKSWSRNLESHELAQLIDMLLLGAGDKRGFVVDVTPEQFATLRGDLRRHFMAVRDELNGE